LEDELMYVFADPIEVKDLPKAEIRMNWTRPEGISPMDAEAPAIPTIIPFAEMEVEWIGPLDGVVPIPNFQIQNAGLLEFLGKYFELEKVEVKTPNPYKTWFRRVA
jgi:hypothetical protein